jgi:hypothetical protein
MALLVVLAAASACGSELDLAQAIAPDAVVTGWTDAPTVAGKNKIVPAVSFRLKNISDRTLGAVQVNAVFRRVNEPGEWSSKYLPNAATAMPPRGLSPARLAVADQGYTGSDDTEALLRNSHFVDVTADLFVRSGSSKWTRVGEYPIARTLLPPPAR